MNTIPKKDITVYVLPSGSRKTDFDKVAEVCSQFASRIVKANSLIDAVEKMGNVIVPHTWNLILHDDEIPEPAFVSNLDAVLDKNPNDCLVVFKRGKDQTPSKSVRFFRAGVACSQDCFAPANANARVGNYLQGFILGIARYV